MPKKSMMNAASGSTLLISQNWLHAIHSKKRTIWRPNHQPIWPTRNIAFTNTDRDHRRRLISHLAAPCAAPELHALAYRLFMCSHSDPCHSPLCNYCRTKMQNRYQKRVEGYFKLAPHTALYWLTVLDDLTYNPVVDTPTRSVRLKRKIKAALESDELTKTAQLFGAFELDAKAPSSLVSGTKASALLTQYGLISNAQAPFMPHYHAIVALPGGQANDLQQVLRLTFDKPYQVSVIPFDKTKPKSVNLTTLARYMFKFRYQFADNILRSKPSYGNLFDPDTLRAYAATIHVMIGSRGLRQFEMKYNLG